VDSKLICCCFFSLLWWDELKYEKKVFNWLSAVHQTALQTAHSDTRMIFKYNVKNIRSNEIPKGKGEKVVHARNYYYRKLKMNLSLTRSCSSTMDTNEVFFRAKRMESFMKITFLCARHAFNKKKWNEPKRRRKLRKHENRKSRIFGGRFGGYGQRKKFNLKNQSA
jgi:hypothetical protein